MTTTDTQTEQAPVGPPVRYRIAMPGQFPGHKPTRLVLGWAVPQEPTGFLVRAVRQVLVITTSGERMKKALGNVALADQG